nr:DNA-binding protein SMUBP-2 [Leptinotarsa decemlineata]
MSTSVSSKCFDNEKKTKSKEQHLKEAVNLKNIDDVLEKVEAIDNKCSFTACKNRTKFFAIDCKFCKGRFCTTHGLPEIHGCGEAVRREERKKFEHPGPQMSQQKHSENQAKLAMKLRQIQLERKPKGSKSKEKKK